MSPSLALQSAGSLRPGVSTTPIARFDALDALRGFAILTMALSGAVERSVLPAWMYHAQLPPPDHQFDPTLAGLTWVDLVFPFFLFSLGAAIPLAQARRLTSRATTWSIVSYNLRRGLLLLGFAIHVQHINPWLMNDSPDAATWIRSLIGFGLLFPILMRFPRHWPTLAIGIIRTAGVAGAVALLGTQTYSDNTGFDPLRSDIIIIVLANVAAVGGIIWWLTAQSPHVRVALLAGLFGLRLAAGEDGWVRDFVNLSFLSDTGSDALDTLRMALMRYVQPYYLQYLHIVIPGTLMGDLLVRWQSEQHTSQERANARQDWAAIGLLTTIIVLVVAGLQGRWLPQTTFLAAAGCLIAGLQMRHAGDTTAVLLRNLFSWGVLWLAVGLIFESYEGGIKKDSPTISYYYVTSGLALMSVVVLFLLQRCIGRGWLAVLIDNGKNPMIAYAGIRGLVPPLLGLAALWEPADWLFSEVRQQSLDWLGVAWTGALRGVFHTMVLGLLTMGFTRLRIYWRT
jgi:predicted acyltransferase